MLYRTLTYAGPAGLSKIEVSIGLPSLAKEQEAHLPPLFEANITIRGNGIDWSGDAIILDEIEVLQNAFSAIRNQLDGLEGEVYWLAPGDNGGFPKRVMQAFGPDITRRQEAVLAAELDAIFAHVPRVSE